jgi:hypothetical protein
MTQRAHRNLQLDIDDVIARTATVRESAKSPPATPNALCMSAGVAGMPVLSRCISEGVTLAN